MAALALSSFLVAMYTLAFLASSAYAHLRARDKGEINKPFQPGDQWNTLTVSFPIPVLPPVTMTTFPVKFGMSSAVKLDFGAK